MQNPRISLLVAAALVAIIACGSDDTTVTAPVSNIVTFKATMTFAAETPTPPVASTGSGTFTATLDTVTNVFIWDLTFTGLTSGVNNGHIHGPASTTTTAGTTINFNTATGSVPFLGLTTGTGHGSILLVAATQITTTPAPGINGDSLKKLLFAGQTYANIHTTSNPSGGIRGQIIKQ